MDSSEQTLGIFFLWILTRLSEFLTQVITVLSPHLPRKLKILVNRDLRAAVLGATLFARSRLVWNQNLSASGLFEQTVKKHPNKIAFKYKDRDWTFRQIDEYANQVGHFFQTETQLKRGDCVALIATSSPQYIAIWLGLNKIGCITALVNFQLKGDALRHAITVAESKMVIVGADLIDNYLPITLELESVEQSFVFTESNVLPNPGHLPCFDDAISGMPKTKPILADPPGYWDRLYYIYTSGTTGLPKPCIITSHRAFTMAVGAYSLAGMKETDVMLSNLPLYHSSGNMGIGQALFMGMTVVLKKNFSASRFWDDVRKDNCTVFVYIGELCRYILAQPPSHMDSQHSLRCISGVGLRKELAAEFKARFRVPMIIECYASTEGNVGFANFDGHPGAIGFTNFLVEHFKQQVMIKVDPDTNEPLRDKQGFCIPCKADEPGELIGRISNSRFESFDGYKDKKATQSKQLSNVFRKGDSFFRSGDILVKDKEGYVYFVDRAGDTFRWKGENVSTTEVENTISRLLDGAATAVFGVSVPGCDGKAGMASICTSENQVDFIQLSRDVNKNLTAFARPVFLRFQQSLDLTGTFKITKTGLKEAGFNIDKCQQDPLYYYDTTSSEYCRLTSDIYQRIMAGSMRM